MQLLTPLSNCDDLHAVFVFDKVMKGIGYGFMHNKLNI